MLNRLSLWQRIAIPVLAMVFGIVVVSGILISHYHSRVSEAKGMTQSAEVILAVSHFIHEVQKERAASVLFLNGVYTRKELQAQRDASDKDLLIIKQIELPSATLKSQVDSAVDQYQKLRNSVDQKSTSASEAAKMIGVLIDDWIKIQVACAHAFHLDGRESTLLSISIFEKSKESMGRLRALLNAVLSANQPINATTVSLLATHKAGVLSNMESPGLSISSSSRQEIGKLLAGEEWLSILATYDTVIQVSDTGNYGFDAKQFSVTITRVIDGLRNVIEPEIILTAKSIESASQEAQISFYFCAAGIFLLIVVSILIAVYVTNKINASLNGVAVILSHGADSVARIAVEVAVASQNLASSATEQAAALQETTAAVEEGKAMTGKNAENSNRSAELSQQSYDTALKGKGLVTEMAHSIKEIARSSAEIMEQNEASNKDLMEIVRVIREIEGKTRVINDIVFQTRLLSFNASVEAARAGEHGKGFAVVAEEVGNLAQMSGSSSREIQAMLDEGVRLVETIVNSTRQRVEHLSETAKEKIDVGVITAERCGEILQQIVDNVSQVGKMTNEISMSCYEQSEGISELNRAISELDAAAHQNSTACEQTSASAEELKTQAEKLLSMVGQLQQVIHGKRKTPAGPVEVHPQDSTSKDDEQWDQAA